MKARLSILAALFASASVATTLPALAQAYPNKPVTLVVPSGPGGGADIVARRLEKVLSRQLSQPVVVVNRPGSGSIVGTMAVLNAARDGYTLLMGGLSTSAFNGAMYKKLPYDPLADLITIGLVAQTPYVMVARNELSAKDANQVKAFALAHPGELNIGNAGTGTGQQVLAAAYLRHTNADIVQIPYQGAQAVYTDLLGGRVDLFIDTLPSARRFIEGKLVRPLLLTGSKRDPLFPNVPTARELGMPSVEMTSWYGVFAPAQTPPAVVLRLQKALELAVADEELRSLLLAGGFEPITATPVAEANRFIQSEYKKWTQVIHDAHISLD